jgi:inner membrane protein
LFGAALARSGLASRTALGGTALIVGANLPDLDGLAYFAGPAADLAWRRGWSHGVLALGLLPFGLTGLLLLVNQWRRRAWPTSDARAVIPRRLLFLSFGAILSHPVLDTLNTYGVRWLMPFSGRWFYGDALFIVDPWVWLLLGTGVVWSWLLRRRRTAAQELPARLILCLTMLYMAAMWVSGVLARNTITQKSEEMFNGRVGQIMAAPIPISPLTRRFVLEQDSVYRVGTFRWLADPQVDVTSLRSFPRGRPVHPALTAAESTQVMRRFLSWARYPTFTVQQMGPDSYLVQVIDLRYARDSGRGFGSLRIPISLPQSPGTRPEAD